MYNLLLGLFDNGRIRSNKDMVYDARQCIIIMTTNAIRPADRQRHPIGFDSAAASLPDPRTLLKTTFPEEFLDRVDEIILFNDLTEENLHSILKLRLEESIDRLFNQGITLRYKESDLLEYLLRFLKNEKCGARKISRILEKKLLQPIAKSLLQQIPGEKSVIELDELFYEKQVISFR